MNTWSQLAHYGKTTGIWEAGSRLGSKKETNGGHQQRNWDFSKIHRRRLGRGFYAALNRIPETEYKRIIVDIVKQHSRRSKLTERQWKYLGFLMTKADPACIQNPSMKSPIKKKEEPKPIEQRFIGRRPQTNSL